jgi:carbonic anhydrase/acetyltransferase-like protein (isoleucine patch superfamily)
VEVGAVVVMPAMEDLAAMNLAGLNIVIDNAQPCAVAASENSRPFYSSRMPILGNDILRSWMELVRKLGVGSVWLTSSATDGGMQSIEMAELARQGVERLLVIKLKSYAEMDLADLLRFHCESRNPVTEAHDARGQLGVCLLDRLALHGSGDEYATSGVLASSALTSEARGGGRSRSPYQFRGYAKRIWSARERQELVGDGLTAACAMRPLGTQIRDHVWIGEGVKLASSVRLVGPTYIGDRSTIRAGATIGPFASVEHDCVVDCGTTIEHSTVLPHTYLAPGILIRHQLVDGRHLEDLRWGTVADLQPAGLGKRIERRESRRKAFSEANVFSRAGSASTVNFVECSAASQAWLQVKL